MLSIDQLDLKSMRKDTELTCKLHSDQWFRDEFKMQIVVFIGNIIEIESIILG